MSDRWTEQILDSMLEEVLTQKHPPDLTDRIVDAWKHDKAARPANGRTNGSAIGPAFDRAIAQTTDKTIVARARVAAAPPRTRKIYRRKTWVAPFLSVAASGLLVLASWQYWKHSSGRLVAERAARELAQKAGPSAIAPSVAREAAAPKPALGNSIASVLPEVPRDQSSALERQTNPQLPDNPVPVTPAKSVAASSALAAALSDKQIVDLIDSQFKALWDRLEITPANALNKAELIRNSCRELTGPAISVEFARGQMANNRPDQRVQMVQALIESDGFAQFWADRLAVRWMLGTVAANSSTEAGKTMRSLLGREIALRTPWNKIVANLVHPESADDNASNIRSQIFLTSFAENDNRRLASRVGNLMLDQRVGCAQCHETAAGVAEQSLQQEQFWSLVASLAGLSGRDPGGKQIHQLVDTQAELFANDGRPGVFFELADGRVQNAIANLPDGQPWTSDSTAKTPRQALAKWLAQSPQIDRAIVNQVWQIVFGRPLVAHPSLVDDVGIQEREELLHALALQFRAHDHNLPQLVSWLVLSDVFSRQPLAIDRQRWLNAGEADFERWNKMEGAFAAAGTLGNSAEAKSLESSLAAVLNWNGLETAAARSKSLAQPSIDAKNGKAASQAAQKLTADLVPSASYLVHASWHLPAQREYIRKIAQSGRLEWRDQVQHVVGLTGDYSLSPSVEKLADQILAESSKNVETALLQLLWAVRNSDAS